MLSPLRSAGPALDAGEPDGIMDPRAADLISSLGLAPHPEGGYFREVYRSASRVGSFDGRSERASLTTIYFLLTAGDVSRWHRVASDEVWHYYEGGALTLFTADAHFRQVTRRVLGRVGDDTRPVHVVPAGEWQAARPTGAYSLAGCTVGPGFEFADFQLLRDRADDAEAVRRRHPDVAEFI
jgi:predicted cupin superfamily sugar epimerase